MRRENRTIVSAATLFTAMLAAAPPAPGAQTVATISTAPAPAQPRIQGPFTFAARPATPLVFAIPATGQKPLTFAATGLPAGLSLATDTGIISGTMPAAGSYPVQVTVTSSAGSAQATVTLVAGSTISLTPPAGWNSYDSYGASIKESEVLAQAQAIRSTLQPYGWSYVVIDYRWYEPQLRIDANGRYLPSTDKYPSATGSNGFKSLADQVHALGLGFGIHIMRGIPRKSFDANTPIAGTSYAARDAGNSSDPCPWDTHMWGVRGDTAAGQAWYDSIFAQYAAWGIDFIKIDDMVNNDTKTYHQSEVDAIRKAIDKSGRSIVLSLSPGPMLTTWATNLNTNANMWRIVNDFWDYNGLSTLADVFTTAGNWQGVSALTAGHWPDGDMLPLGYLGPRNEWHASGQTTFSKNEQVTIMTLWSIMPSPLIFGGNPQSLGSDAWTTALLTNEEVMAVNQDASGTHAKRIVQQGTTEVWARDLSGKRKAVALFNRGTQDATISVSLSQLGMSAPVAVRDAWHRADVSGVTTSISSSVPYSSALLYVVTPQSGSGGSGGGAGGAMGSGGQTGSGGAGGPGGSGGATGSGGRMGSGGQVGAGGVGSGGTGAGGVAGGTGAGGMRAGTGGAGGTSTAGEEASGCACELAQGGNAAAGLALLVPLLLSGVPRRRR